MALLSLVVLGGCPNATQRSLRRAAKAMEECDIRTANTEFDDAWTRSPDDIDAALGFALTDLVMMAEDKHLGSALLKLGFTETIDAENLIYGKNALLEVLTESGDCDLVDELAEDELAYAPFWDDVSPAEVVSDGVTIADLLEDVSAMQPRLKRLADAFEAAADVLEEPYELELSGSCGAGIGKVTINTPELLAAASALTVIRAGLTAAEGYDWDLELRVLFGEDSPVLTETYNAHLLHVVDAAAIAQAGPILVSALDLADRALAEAASINKSGPDLAFDWSKLERGLIEDLRIIGDAARESIAQGQPQQIPFWSIPLEVDLGSFFSDPPDAAKLDGPLFITDEYGYTYADTRQFEALISDRFDRDIFNSTQDEYLDLERWEDTDLAATLDPGERYSDAYSCD